MIENFIEVEGLRIRCLAEGGGRAVLLLHGASLGSSADVWAGNLAGLAAHGLRLIACDLPGFGLSDNPKDHSVAYRTRFVLRLMDALGLSKAYLVGHSQAGRIAVRLALDHPGRVSRVVVLATGSLLPPLPGAKQSDAVEGEEGGTGEPTLEDTRKALEATLYDASLVSPEALQTRHRMSTGKNFRAFLGRQLTRGGEKEAKPLWQRLVEVPALRLIYGKEDRGNAAERAALAKKLYPRLDLHLIDRCKHLVQWDAAEEFVALCGSFLAGRK
jgi:pimeloyl-ACP methyl ester carboxylesterase